MKVIEVLKKLIEKCTNGIRVGDRVIIEEATIMLDGGEIPIKGEVVGIPRLYNKNEFLLAILVDGTDEVFYSIVERAVKI